MKTLKSRFTTYDCVWPVNNEVPVWWSTIALSFRRCDWLFPLSAREVSSGNRSNYKSTRERVDSKGLYGRWRLHLMGALLFIPVSGSRCLFSPSIEVANRQLITVANICFQLNFGLFGRCKLKWRLSVVNKSHPDPLIQTLIYCIW